MKYDLAAYGGVIPPLGKPLPAAKLHPLVSQNPVVYVESEDDEMAKRTYLVSGIEVTSAVTPTFERLGGASATLTGMCRFGFVASVAPGSVGYVRLYNVTGGFVASGPFTVTSLAPAEVVALFAPATPGSPVMYEAQFSTDGSAGAAIVCDSAYVEMV